MQQRIQEISAELCREMYGEDECPRSGTRFSRIEDDAVAVADAISREVMQSLFARQAAQVPQATLSYPDYGGPCERGEEDGGQKEIDGGEAILQLVADHLSDQSPLERFWTRRENQGDGVRRRC